jgi:formamidopyrimidine-DNA glycosylase
MEQQMPELPEIETIKRGLQKNITGKRVVHIDVRDSRLRWPVETGKLATAVLNKEILKITRRAKYLLVELEGNQILIMHLGMSGSILLLGQNRTLDKHDHVVFYFDDRSEMRFRDPRRFGMIDTCPASELASHPRLKNLGFEPLSETLSGEILHQQASHSKKPIKNTLMDASFIVGVGNIYANEALFAAGIHPLTSSNRLQASDWQRLLAKIQHVLESAIAKGGTTLNDFVNSTGDPGYFQLSLAVYGREAERCVRCGTEVRKIVLVGRSTFFCPDCQPKP